MIQSAEELTDYLRECKPYEQTTSDFDEYQLGRGEAVDLIRSRDKAIIDRCKIALIECSEIGVDKYLSALDAVSKEL
jgi:hypothetical protein